MPEREPDQAPIDEMHESEPLGGDGERVDQQNVGPESRGGGEFPDPHAPPSESAPGDLRPTPEPGQGQFQEVYDLADDQVAAVGSINREKAEPADEA